MKRLLFLRAYLAWLLAAGFFFAEYFARVSPSVMGPHLMRDLHLHALGLGSLSACFYYAYVGMQLPVGTLVDRYGPHRLLTAMATLCGLACCLFAGANTLWVANIARFLMGFSAAFAFVGALKLAHNWFSSARFGFLAGATQALGMVGAAVGEGPVGLLVKHIGWRYSMTLIGIILLALGALIAVVVRDYPSNTPSHSVLIKNNHNHLAVWKNLSRLFRSKQCWINGIFSGFLFAPTAVFAIWGPIYLHENLHIHMPLAGSLVGLIFIGFAISSPLAGWISDRIKQRKPIMLLSALCCVIFMSAAIYLPALNIWEEGILLFLYGVSNVAVATSYAVACELVPRHLSATSMSFANMASVIIGAFAMPMIGALLQLGWNHAVHHGIPIYSVHNSHHALLCLPACTLVSLIAGCFLKESYRIPQKKTAPTQPSPTPIAQAASAGDDLYRSQPPSPLHKNPGSA
jgi:MFS family permease